MGGSFKASNSFKFSKIAQKRSVNFFQENDFNDAQSVAKSNTSSYYNNKNAGSILKNAAVRQQSDVSPMKRFQSHNFEEFSSMTSSNNFTDNNSYITEESAFSKSQAISSKGNADIGTSLKLTLKNKSLKKLDFLTKFVREFPNIKHIDLGNNAIGNDEMEKFMGALETNDKIQDIEIGGNKIGANLKSRMQKELDKNKQINGLIEHRMF